jgi:dihydropteroate synthase
VIWARPLSLDGGEPAPEMVWRSGAPVETVLDFCRSMEQTVLLTGLDEAGRAALSSVAGPSVLWGSRDAAVVRVSHRATEKWAPQLASAPQVASALRRWSDLEAPVAPMSLGPKQFEWGRRTFVMGVLNLTPDSFSDGGRLGSVEAAVARAKSLADAGADLIDLGGESTRPGAVPVDEEEELRRIVPVIEAVARQLPQVPLSVDTSKPEVARRAVAAGAHLVNDVTGLVSEAMLEAIADLRVAACVMHMRGEPRTMQKDTDYDDVVGEVLDVLEARLARAEAFGIPRRRLLVDPGIGFGKTADQNLFLLRNATVFRLLGAAVLIGTSRKSFLAPLTGGKPPEARDGATAASVAALAVKRAVDVVRVHDVAATREALNVADAIARAHGGGRLFRSEPG